MFERKSIATEAQRLGNVKRKLSQVSWTCVQTGTHNVADGEKKINVIAAV